MSPTSFSISKFFVPTSTPLPFLCHCLRLGVFASNLKGVLLSIHPKELRRLLTHCTTSSGSPTFSNSFFQHQDITIWESLSLSFHFRFYFGLRTLNPISILQHTASLLVFNKTPPCLRLFDLQPSGLSLSNLKATVLASNSFTSSLRKGRHYYLPPLPSRTLR